MQINKVLDNILEDGKGNPIVSQFNGCSFIVSQSNNFYILYGSREDNNHPGLAWLYKNSTGLYLMVGDSSYVNQFEGSDLASFVTIDDRWICYKCSGTIIDEEENVINITTCKELTGEEVDEFNLNHVLVKEGVTINQLIPFTPSVFSINDESTIQAQE
jgi:hypothetical protein